MDLSTRFQILAEERRRFEAGLEVDRAKIRPVVLDSWEACKAAKVPQEGPPGPGKIAGKEIFAENAELIAVARNVLREYLDSLAPEDVICALHSREGVLLFVAGKSPAMDRVEPRAVGSYESEGTVGTTSIGLALKHGKSIEIFGAEYWRTPLQDRYGCTSPIVLPNGALAGFLSTSLPLAKYTSSWPSIAGIMAAAIGSQLELERQAEVLRELFESVSDGMLLADENGRILQANAIARRMLSLPSEGGALPGEFFDFACKDGKFSSFSRRELTYSVRGRAHACLVSCKPSPKGAVFVLSTIQGMAEFVAGQAGFMAHYTFDDLKGTSAAFLDCVELARNAASSDIATLLLGESGVGKELFAQAIHNASGRKNGPFISINCGSIPGSLIQSELFGYAEGSFTGAAKAGRPGKFELANHGTIFLDEIGEMPPDAQVALLRVLQEKRVVRVGDDRERRVDVRVIAATNCDLESSVESGQFRRDLYFRLKVFPLQIPPLRDRQTDILPLLRYFLQQASERLGKSLDWIDPAVLAWAEEYAWPGNVRELENLAEGLGQISQGGRIEYADLQRLAAKKVMAAPSRPLTPEGKRKIVELEKDAVIGAVRAHAGNINQAAASLGVTRNTVYNKLRRWGLEVRDFRLSQN